MPDHRPAILGIEIDMSELTKKVRETEKQLGMMTQMIDAYKKAEERQQEFLNESPTYIR